MREKIDLMDRFIKDSTHELNTPVTTMLLALHKIDKKGCKSIYLRSLQMSVIFDRFHRENSVEGGFGIGLDIVKTICNIYGFRIDVVSKMKKGSSFIVDFNVPKCKTKAFLKETK